MGVLFGVAIFFAVPAQPDDVLWKYLAIYSPVRLVEWFIVACIVRRHAENPAPKSTLLWCLGGIAVSFAADEGLRFTHRARLYPLFERAFARRESVDAGLRRVSENQALVD